MNGFEGATNMKLSRILQTSFFLQLNLINGNEESIKNGWLNYNGTFFLSRWTEYIERYDYHLTQPYELSGIYKILEIGVQSGGSLKLWKDVYKDKVLLVGIDIDSQCLRSHEPHKNVHVEIGSQTNSTFLKEVCLKYGPFDVVIDDGGHRADTMQVALTTLFADDNCMTLNSYYVIEDTHSMTLCSWGFCEQPEDIYSIVGLSFYSMHSHWYQKQAYSDVFQHKLAKMHLYDSMIFFKREAREPLHHLSTLSNSYANYLTRGTVETSPSLKKIWFDIASDNHDRPLQQSRYVEYGERYEFHFPRPQLIHSIKMLIIGINDWSFFQLWEKYYDIDNLVIVGLLAIGERVTQRLSRRVFIEYGDFSNEEYLANVCIKYGVFDIIINGGASNSNILTSSLKTFFSNDNCMALPSWFVIEDTFRMVNCIDRYCQQPYDIYGMIDQAYYSMHGHWYEKKAYSEIFQNKLYEMHLYDGMVFMYRNDTMPLRVYRRGHDYFLSNEVIENAEYIVKEYPKFMRE